jgi:hypothetical protein
MKPIAINEKRRLKITLVAELDLATVNDFDRRGLAGQHNVDKVEQFERGACRAPLNKR